MIVPLEVAIPADPDYLNGRTPFGCPSCFLPGFLRDAGWSCLSGMFPTDRKAMLDWFDPELLALPKIKFVIADGRVCSACLSRHVEVGYRTVWARRGLYQEIYEVVSGRTAIGDLSVTAYLKLLGGRAHDDDHVHEVRAGSARGCDPRCALAGTAVGEVGEGGR